MTEQERKLVKRIKTIVTSGVVVLFCSVVALVVTLGVSINKRAQADRLERVNTELRQALDDGIALGNYYMTQEFIREYALKVLGYGRDGSKIFKR